MDKYKQMKKKLLITGIILTALIILTIIFITICKTIDNKNKNLTEALPEEELPELPSLPTIYGFIEDSFIVEQNFVMQNQNLSAILLSQKVDYKTIQHLTETCKPLFDVRRIRAGNKYTFLLSNDSLQTPLYFIYEIDKIDYLVIELTNGFNVSRRQKESVTVRKKGSGIISSSLWNSIKENELNPVLAVNLSDIYAWTIDFFGIEKGDFFKVIYDEIYVENVSIGIEAVHAALFEHRGKKYWAFRYEQDSILGFFDEKGQSLRKAFLKAPLNFSRISSRFSNNRFHPILKINRPHHGVDYSAPQGTPVYAIGDGQITHKGWDAQGGGNYIKIKHNIVYTSTYMHLQGFAKDLKNGEKVKQGQLIGYVGKTGLATGPHLDFRIHKNGAPVDPLKVEAPPVEPIKEDKMEEFLEFITSLKNEFNTKNNQNN